MADAQYVIDIASTMTGGNQTLAQLDALTENLLGSGKNASFFQEAISDVSKQLAGAGEAAKIANAALAEGGAEFSRLERAAVQAAKAAEKAAQQNGNVVPDDLAAKFFEANRALVAHVDALGNLEKAAAAADAKEKKLSDTFGNLKTLNGHVNTSLGATGEKIEKLRGALGAAGGSAGQLASNLLAPVQGFAKLSAEMGTSQAAAVIAGAAVAALTVAVVALAAAAVVATVKIASWAVGLADSARSASLAADANKALHPTLAALDGSFASLTAQTGLHADALQGLALQLEGAKVKAKDMPAALQAAALASAALGNAGVSAFVDDIKAGKVAVDVLAATTTSKLGGIVAKQMLGLDAQSARLHDNIGKIFGGLNIDPVLSGLQTIVNLFDESTAAGQAAKFLFESVFQPLIDKAESAAFVVEAFYLGVLIGATKLYIALKPAIKAVSDLFGFDDTTFSDLLAGVTKAGEYLAPVLIGVAAVVGVLAGAVALVVGLPVVAGLSAWAGIFYVVKTAVGAVYDAFTAVVAFISNIPFADIGANIIAGLVAGITGNAAAFVSALGGVVTGAIDHAKSLLGIHSPSTVTAGIADDTADGFVNQTDARSNDVQDAMVGALDPSEALKQAQLSGDVSAVERLTSPADSAQPANDTAPAAAGASANLAGAVFNFYGVEGAEDAVAKFGEMLTRVLEGDALQAGAV